MPALIAILVLAAGQTVAAPATPATPCPSPQPKAMNLNWAATDVNGFPRNPWWVAQDTSNTPIDPSDPCTCGGFPRKTGVPMGDPKCTETAGSDVPGGFHNLTCMLEWFRDFRTGVTRGHINWFPVLLSGYIWFENHSGPDDDINFELTPDTRSPTGGVPGQTKWNPTAGDQPRPNTLHVEFKKSESLDHLQHPWWKEFTDGVDDDKARSMVSAARAIVIGLFGIDAEHQGHSEIHPAYALAARTSCAANGPAVTETWSIFARNYGNEGWCSRWSKWHRLALNNDALTLQLPLDARAKAITLDQAGSLIYANRAHASAGLASSSGNTADVQLKWPALGPADDLRLHGQLKLAWQVDGAATGLCAPAPVSPNLAARLAEEDDGEALLTDIIRRAAARQPESLRAAPSIDSERVSIATATATTVRRTGVCPRNATSCDDAVRARVPDAFFSAAPAAALAESRRVAPIDLALCQSARDMLPEYRARASQAMVDSPEGRKLRRLESLVSMCEVPQETN